MSAVARIRALCALSGLLSAPLASQSCPVSSPRGVEIAIQSPQALAGHYVVRMFRVPRGDSAARDSGRVELWLWPSSSLDSSPTLRVRAAAGDTASYPLFGAAFGDFWAVHATVHPTAVPAVPPRRADIDPVTARVLAVASPPASTIIIAIGTLASRVPGFEAFDGAGIALRIQARTHNEFRGDWINWGIVVGGVGYYCADRVGSAT